MKTTIWIISGPTSCGKSTFIENCPWQKIGLPSKNLPVFFPAQLLKGAPLLGYKDVILHYNILRPKLFYSILTKTRPDQHAPEGDRCLKKLLAFFVKSKQQSFSLQSFSWEELKPIWNYKSDPLFDLLTRMGVQLKACVLVANRNLIRRRILKRKFAEKKRFLDKTPLYNRTYWLSVLNCVNLFDVYNSWLNFLQQNQIEYQLYNSNTLEFVKINDPRNIEEILYGE